MAKAAKHPNLVKLGERIRASRQELSWSQERLAEKTEIDRSYIGGVERGERNVSFTTLCKIADALGTNVSRLTKRIP